jgi:hypothetical protein
MQIGERPFGIKAALYALQIVEAEFGGKRDRQENTRYLITIVRHRTVHQ